MHQDYMTLSLAEHEAVEKQSLRTVVQALQQYSREARAIFETTKTHTEQEVIVLGEDLVQYALEVAEVYPIDRRYPGFFDYKRCRWLPTPFGLIPQVLLVDAKASTENNRETLQQSQLPMDADWTLSRGQRRGVHASLAAGVEPHMELLMSNGGRLHAVTTSLFVHWYYTRGSAQPGKHRDLHSIYVFAAPHANMKSIYNPTPTQTIYGEGKQSSARNEEPRIRIYYNLLRRARPWRLQELHYDDATDFTRAVWRDGETPATESHSPFAFIAR